VRMTVGRYLKEKKGGGDRQGSDQERQIASVIGVIVIRKSRKIPRKKWRILKTSKERLEIGNEEEKRKGPPSQASREGCESRFAGKGSRSSKGKRTDLPVEGAFSFCEKRKKESSDATGSTDAVGKKGGCPVGG